MNTFIESFLELIYPEKNICCICGTYDDEIGENYICWFCEQKFKKPVPPTCAKCSRPINYNSENNLCSDCSSDEKYFEISKSIYMYEGLIKECIYKFKYYNKPYFYRFFGNSMIKYMKDNNYNDFNFILAVPLHSSKLRSRGYNQSELLAKYISEKLNIPYINGLKRIKKTLKQSSKSKEERKKNLTNAFIIRRSNNIELIKNNNVLLVDDVYTTGSTVNECTKVLLDYGVNKVFVLTIAR